MTRVRAGTKELRRDGAADRRRIREACRADRTRLTEDARARREALRDAIREERAALRGRCSVRLREAREATDRAIEEARRSAMQLDRLRRAARTPAQTAAAERARFALATRIAESDDEVRRNISDELRPAWEKMKRRIKAGPRRTRTEAFLEWVHDHPNEAARFYREAVEVLPPEETEDQYRERTASRRLAPLDLEDVPF